MSHFRDMKFRSPHWGMFDDTPNSSPCESHILYRGLSGGSLTVILSQVEGEFPAEATPAATTDVVMEPESPLREGVAEGETSAPVAPAADVMPFPTGDVEMREGVLPEGFPAAEGGGEGVPGAGAGGEGAPVEEEQDAIAAQLSLDYPPAEFPPGHEMFAPVRQNSGSTPRETKRGRQGKRKAANSEEGTPGNPTMSSLPTSIPTTPFDSPEKQHTT